jgi:ferredoxin/flavodoxin
VYIVYFSGTGCTKLASEYLGAALTRQGASIRMEELHAGTSQDVKEPADLLVLMYPVYALSAPGPVYAFIRSLADAANTPAAVISVSGGGEVTPNKACRVRVIRRLSEKGFYVFYENMLVMPSNVFTPTPPEVALGLIRVLPGKADRIARALLRGEVRRTRPGLLNRLLAFLGEFEKFGAKRLGHHIRVSPACTGCGSCASDCPSGNITLRDGKPVFGKKCVTCLKCYYSCPQKALSPIYGKFIVLKEGFDLPSLVRAAESGGDISEVPSGPLWVGLKSYMEEKD